MSYFDYKPLLGIGKDARSVHKACCLCPSRTRPTGAPADFLLLRVNADLGQPSLSLAAERDRIRSELSEPQLRLCLQLWSSSPLVSVIPGLASRAQRVAHQCLVVLPVITGCFVEIKWDGVAKCQRVDLEAPSPVDWHVLSPEEGVGNNWHI